MRSFDQPKKKSQLFKDKVKTTPLSPLGHENVLNICQTPIMKSIQSLIWQPVKIAPRSLTVQLEVEPKWS